MVDKVPLSQVLSAVESAAINVLAVEVVGHTIPPHVQSIIRGCKGAVLVFHRQGEDGS